jgi:hypothetical protein
MRINARAYDHFLTNTMLEREKKSMYNKIQIQCWNEKKKSIVQQNTNKNLIQKGIGRKGSSSTSERALGFHSKLLLRGSLGQFLASTFGWHHTASCQHRSAQQGLINPSPQLSVDIIQRHANTLPSKSRRVKIELIIKKSGRPKPVNSCPPELGLQACATRPGEKRVTRPFLC